MPNTNLVHMQMPKKTTKEQSAPETIGYEKYPYGLEINLNTESLKKLGIDVSKYKIGENITVYAKAKIERIEQSERMGSGQNQSMTIQITHLQLKSGTGVPSQMKSGKSVDS